MKQVIDNFSTGSADYSAYRPASPAEVFEFIYSKANSFDTAWDCGTGNGQVAATLAERFGKIYGTDISGEQMALAPQLSNITYLQERAEQTSLPTGSIDLITIAQAIHWFDFDKFYEEVRRVTRPGALIAAWTYVTMKLTPEVNEVIEHFYNGITRPYWDKERALVDAGYQTIPFPFREIPTPEFKIIKHWTLEQFAGYLRTWSGVKNYVKKEGSDPLLLVMDDLQRAWGPSETLEVYWPVHMRAGYVE